MGREYVERQERVPLLKGHRVRMGFVKDLEEGEVDASLSDNNNLPVGVQFTPKKWPQFAATFLAGISLLAVGSTMVWTSPALPDLEKSDKFENLTSTDTSWIASVVTLGAVVSGPVAGYLVDGFGRKTTLFIFSFPFLAGWLLVSFAPTVVVMIIGRFILGFCVGGFILAAILYTAEISDSSIRGIIMSMSTLTMGFGMMLAYAFGSFCSWFELSLINVGYAVVIILTVPFLPESPLYLISKDKIDLAEKSLMRLRGATDARQIRKELNELQAHDLETKEIQKQIQGTLWTNLKRPGTLKAFGISLVLAALQQLCGLNAVNFYTKDIFAASNTDIDENISSIIIGVDIIVSGVVCANIIEKFGRRKLLIISLTGLALCLSVLGAFFFAYRENDEGNAPTPDSYTSWIPLASLIFFQFFYMIGIGPLAWSIMGEILPMDVKGPTSAVVTSFNWLLAFVVTKTFEDLVDSFGIYSCFWGFGGVAIIGLVFSVLFVPETQGKTFEEIQKLYFS